MTEPKTGLRAVGASFLVLFAAEWGDLSQLLIAGLVASGRNPIATGLGAWLGLAAVSGLAVLLGRWLLKRVRLSCDQLHRRRRLRRPRGGDAHLSRLMP